MAIRHLKFEHKGTMYRLEIDDYGDTESSDTVDIYGPGDDWISNYDTCLSSDAAIIAEAKHELT